MITIAFICVALFLSLTSVRGQVKSVSPVKIYRGSIGDLHIEMKLRSDGEKVSGTYSYDHVRQELGLSGHPAQGRLELAEFDASGKQTGKFLCKRKLDDEIDPECTWSKPDGTGETYVILNEQHIAFTNGLRIVPKVITNRKTGVNVSYPQIIGGGGSLALAAEKFNSRVGYVVNKAIKEFQPVPDRGYFEANYNVLLATNDIVSIEVWEASYAGGAHPDSSYWAVTYNLVAGRELRLDDLFKLKSNYRKPILTYCLGDINRRAEEISKEEARREGKTEQNYSISADDVTKIDTWAMTPKGLMIYFDFPHVIAVFDRTFVPYSVVKQHIKQGGPASRFAARGSNNH